MQSRKHLLRNRRGFSLVEAVVAMAIVVIVTGAALTLIISSTRADVALRDQYRALTACENAEDCIRFAKGDADLLDDALTEAGFVKIPEGSYTLTFGEHTVSVTLKNANYAVIHNGETIYEYPTEETTPIDPEV